MKIDATARIDANVELAPGVEIGPGVIIEGPTRIGSGTRIQAHAYIGLTPPSAKITSSLSGPLSDMNPRTMPSKGKRVIPSSAIIISSGNMLLSIGARYRQRHPGG